MHLCFYLKITVNVNYSEVYYLKRGINTKILPEACTWHFSKYWEHMKINRAGLVASEKNFK